jgi:hypothetical protein
MYANMSKTYQIVPIVPICPKKAYIFVRLRTLILRNKRGAFSGFAGVETVEKPRKSALPASSSRFGCIETRSLQPQSSLLHCNNATRWPIDRDATPAGTGSSGRRGLVRMASDNAAEPAEEHRFH